MIKENSSPQRTQETILSSEPQETILSSALQENIAVVCMNLQQKIRDFFSNEKETLYKNGINKFDENLGKHYQKIKNNLKYAGQFYQYGVTYQMTYALYQGMMKYLDDFELIIIGRWNYLNKKVFNTLDDNDLLHILVFQQWVDTIITYFIDTEYLSTIVDKIKQIQQNIGLVLSKYEQQKSINIGTYSRL